MKWKTIIFKTKLKLSIFSENQTETTVFGNTEPKKKFHISTPLQNNKT
jgi:hypothetical protein